MNFKNIAKTLGPGILFAGAAIGGSHLIQSTRAGANFGLDLLLIVILINVFKYPFFEFGHRYVAATGESLIDGYKKLGNWAVQLFFILNIITAIVNVAAVTLVTASLTANLFNLSIDLSIISAIVLLVTFAILFIGKYSLLDSLMKTMIFILALTTITTVLIAFNGESSMTGNLNNSTPDIWNAAGISFLLALMGWMPAPIESSVWPSLWALERRKQTGYTPKLKECLIDFNIGYIGTTIMALFFVGLGAFVMFGSGETFSNNGVVFSSQLVSLYTKTIGEWSEYIIGSIVLITMVSTTFTVFDAYPRTMSALYPLVVKKYKGNQNNLYWIVGIILGMISFFIISIFMEGMKSLLDLATIVSFLAAPVFAIINYKVITNKDFPESFRPSKFIRVLSWCGIIFLIGFSLIYIYTRLFL